jgi:hypothetical protein
MPTRLYWVGMRGIAKLDGREVKLKAPPHLLGLHIEAIDYVPGLLATVMPSRSGWRDMTADERAQADRLLRELTGSA